MEFLTKASPEAFNLRFLNHFSRILIVTQRHKLGMPQPVSFGPLKKFHDDYELGTDPDAFLHLLGIENLALSGALRLRQVHEWASVRDQRLPLLINHPADCWHKSISHSRDVVQILAAIVSDDDRIDAVRSGNKSANHELLGSIDPHLHPSACTLPRFIEASFALSDDTFESLFANGSKHIVSGNMEPP